MTEVNEPTKMELVTALFECATYVRDIPSKAEGSAIHAHVFEVVERYMQCNRIAYGDDDSLRIFKWPGPLEQKAADARAGNRRRQMRRMNHPVFK
nr:hypothetical protein [uncultured Mediterranean phage uvMED]